jgi:hypothetical protein
MNASLARRVRNAELYTLATFRSRGAIRWAKRLVNRPFRHVGERVAGAVQVPDLPAHDNAPTRQYIR